MLFGFTLQLGLAQNLESLQPRTFEYQEGDTTFVMKQYFMCFLKKGDNREQDEKESAELQKAHLAHINQLAADKKICIAGPFGDDGEIRGILIFATATMEEAKQLAENDPAVKAGRLKVELHPWWAAINSKLF